MVTPHGQLQGAALIARRLRRWPALAARVECVGDLQPPHRPGDVERKATAESSKKSDVSMGFSGFSMGFSRFSGFSGFSGFYGFWMMI